MHEPYDAVVVGAGPGGLTGAIYLGRFRRRFLVLHDDGARAGWIPLTRNHPGFPDGIAGPDLLARMTAQAEQYGADIRRGRVEAVEAGDGLFRLATEAGVLEARFVLLATGVADVEPNLPDVFGAVQKGLIRICPICDGYEVIDQAVGVIGNGEKGAREALFMQTYSPRVTLVHVGEPQTLPAETRAGLAAAGVDLVETRVEAVAIEADRIVALDFGSGDLRRFDVLYSALGSTPRGRLAEALGAEVDAEGCLRVDGHQRTSVDGLYAAGDLVRGLNQISVAQAEAAIAATDIHNRLRAGRLPS